MVVAHEFFDALPINVFQVGRVSLERVLCLLMVKVFAPSRTEN